MHCPNCGRENETNTIFCSECGAWMLGSMYESEVPSSLPEESDQDSAAMKKKLRIFSILGGSLIGIVLICIGLWLFLPKKEEAPRYIYKQSSVYAYAPFDQTFLLYNGTVVEGGIYPASAQGESPIESLDGRTVLFPTDEKKLMIVRDGMLHLTLENFISVRLSASGNALIYVLQENGHDLLYHYDIVTQTKRQICDNYAGNASISPDGKGVAFTTTHDGTTMLQYYKDGQTMSICSDFGNFGLLPPSDNGQQLYVYNAFTVACYDQAGELSVIADSSDTSILSIAPIIRCYFNYDHSQILISDGAVTLYSENGQRAIMYSAATLQPISAAGTGFFSFDGGCTCPAKNLLDMVFKEKDFLFALNSHMQQQLVKGLRLWWSGNVVLEAPQDVWLDKSGRIVYYIDGSQSLMRLDLSQKNAAPIQIASNVESFAIHDDASTLYYVSDSALNSCNAVGKNKKLIADAFSGSVSISCQDVPYALQEGILCAIVDGKVKTVLENVSKMVRLNDGSLYFIAEDGLYISTQDGGANRVIAISR